MNSRSPTTSGSASTIPLFEDLIARGATVVACTHFGRPQGQVVAKYSVAPVRRRLGELCPGVELMENLRFDPGEEKNDPAFGEALIEGVRLLHQRGVQRVASRPRVDHDSPDARAERRGTEPAARGRRRSSRSSTSPARPFVAIVGGAKVKDKLGIVKVLAQQRRHRDRRRRHGVHLRSRPRVAPSAPRSSTRPTSTNARDLLAGGQGPDPRGLARTR